MYSNINSAVAPELLDRRILNIGTDVIFNPY